MEKADILKEINVIFIDILDNDTIVLNYETTANDVEDWDSLNHIQLVVAIEKHFTIRFTSKEIQSWNDVGGNDQFNKLKTQLVSYEISSHWYCL